MAIFNGDGNANSLVGSDQSDTMRGRLGNDELRGLDGPDVILGNEGNDGLYGNGGNDQISGEEGDDLLRGGNGNDILAGEIGDDILYGQQGFNTVYGGSGNDTLVSLGERNAIVPEGATQDAFDDLYGGSGADTFYLLPTSDNEGQLFLPEEKFAVINDFTPGNATNPGDKIVLPGKPTDYRAEFAGSNNGSTAIYYVDNPDIDISLGFGGVSFSTDYAFNLPTGSALVAVLDDTVARNMFNENFYEYTG